MRIVKIALCVALLMGAGTAVAEPYGVGDRIAEFSLDDQHGETGSVDASTRLILFSRDMDGGKHLKVGLADVDPDFLSGKKAVYVADISRMPSLITRMFALPGMRKRPYPMLLDRVGNTTHRLPDFEDQATLIYLKRLKITRVEHVTSANGVRELLGLEPLPEDD